jgi:hypothetical protein
MGIERIIAGQSVAWKTTRKIYLADLMTEVHDPVSRQQIHPARPIAVSSTLGRTFLTGWSRGALVTRSEPDLNPAAGRPVRRSLVPLRRRLAIAAAFAVLAALTLMPGCAGREPEQRQSGNRILLVGMDGLEWSVALPLIQAGELPAFEKMMREGAHGKLQTLTPTSSSIIWTSVATGKLPEKHGILSKMMKDEAGNDVRSYYSTDRSTKALWNIYSDYGLKVHSIGWWKTYPVEEISGVMVAQMNRLFSFDGVQTGVFKGADRNSNLKQVHPAGLLDRVMSYAESVKDDLDRIEGNIFGPFRHPHSALGALQWDKIHWVVTLDTVHHRIAGDLLRSEDPFDLMMVYLRGADVVAHNFWRFTYPDVFQNHPTPAELQNYAGLLPAYYRHLDSLLASLIDEAGPGTTVILLSDHGMESKNLNSSWNLNGRRKKLVSGGHGHAPPGLFLAAGPGIVPGPGAALSLDELTHESIPLIGRVDDLGPTLLALSGLPIGKDMDGKILRRILDQEFLLEYPPGFIPSHDSPGWRESLAEFEPTDEEERDRLEELRSLGYIE